MIYRKEKTVRERNGKISFEKSLKDIQLINFLIRPSNPFPLNSFNLPHNGACALETFKSLMKCEFLENTHLFNSFADAIKDFPDKGTYMRDELKVICQKFKKKHFNGHFDSKIRLKYLIAFYSPIGDMRGCIYDDSDDTGSRWSPNYGPNYYRSKISEVYLSDLRTSGPEMFGIDIFNEERYLSKSGLEFLEGDGRILVMWSDVCVFHLLKALNREGLLTWEMIKSLAGFRDKNKRVIEWNKERFDQTIKDLKEGSFFKEQPKLDKYLKKLGKDSTSLTGSKKK